MMIRIVYSSLIYLAVTLLVFPLSMTSFPLVSHGADNEIAVVVNNIPITTNDITRRVALLKLRNAPGDLQSLARQELTDESLQGQEARRIGVTIPSREVEVAYRKFATDNGMTFFALDKVLADAGVTVRGFKDFIHAGLRWQRTVGLRYRAENRQQPKRLSYIFGGKDDEGIETTQYTLKHIIFVVPKARQDTDMDTRLIQANNFRSTFSGCDDAITLAKNYKDVSVLDRGRVIEDRIPAQWIKEIKLISAGEVTRAIRTDRGIELYAVCETQSLRSASSTPTSSGFGNPANIGTELVELGADYSTELRTNATIREN